MYELQREIDSLRIKVRQLEEVNSVQILANNRLDKLSEAIQNYSTLLAQHLLVEISDARNKDKIIKEK